MLQRRDLRIRIDRLLAGTFLVDDLTRLFLALRGHSFGRTSVQEVGNFVAHADQRDRGLVTDDAKDVFRFFRAAMPQVFGKRLDPSRLPKDFRHFLRKNFHSFELSEIEEKTGVEQATAERSLQGAVKKFASRPDGSEYLTEKLSSDELAITLFCCQNIRIKPLFSASKLAHDFAFVLIKNKLIDQPEESQIMLLEQALALYAIRHMNQVRVKVDQTWIAHLYCSISSDGTLATSVIADFKETTDSIAGLSFIVFSTDINAESVCSPAVMAGLRRRDFDLLIELTPDRKLDVL